MSKPLQREVDRLKKMVLALSAVVEENVIKAVRSVETRDLKLAQTVIDSDWEIDRTEVDIEEECLKVLALHQPVASDLRFIVAMLKINNDLERIGDLAVNIAQRGEYLAGHPPVEIPYDLPGMLRTVCQMYRKGLDALVNTNVALAYEVCAMDDRVDVMNRETFRLVQEGICAQPARPDLILHLLSVSRYLERIADHATNIAEDVIYILEGEIVRHKLKKPDERRHAAPDV